MPGSVGSDGKFVAKVADCDFFLFDLGKAAGKPEVLDLQPNRTQSRNSRDKRSPAEILTRNRVQSGTAGPLSLLGNRESSMLEEEPEETRFGSDLQGSSELKTQVESILGNMDQDEWSSSFEVSLREPEGLQRVADVDGWETVEHERSSVSGDSWRTSSSDVDCESGHAPNAMSVMSRLGNCRSVEDRRTRCSSALSVAPDKDSSTSLSLRNQWPSEGPLSSNPRRIFRPLSLDASVDVSRRLVGCEQPENTDKHRLVARRRTLGYFGDRAEIHAAQNVTPSSEPADVSPPAGGRSNGTSGDVEHVYCTVYCIANDNYRQPSRISPPLDAAGLSFPLPPTRSPHLELDLENWYSLSDLVDPVLSGGGLRGDEVMLTCRVCLDERPIRPLHCCRKSVCDECLKTYVASQVLSGHADMACPIPECSGFLEENLVLEHLPSESLAKYKYFLELSRLDSGTKACPQCSLFTTLKGRSLPAAGRVENKFKVQCSDCQLVWCFKCHAPWHEGIKCRDYRKGDKLLRNWASVIEHGQRNAQKCPRCKIHIQRTEGCDHMTCTQCNTNFCYRCGEKYRHLRFFGDHTSNLSVFGCRFRYLPDRPHLRRFIRGSVCVSKVLVAPLLIVLVVVIGALMFVIGLIAFPVYCICKKRKKHSDGTGRWLC